MYELKDTIKNNSQINQIIEDIEKKAINELIKELLKLNISKKDLIYINDIKKSLLLIKLHSDKEKKERMIKFFLLDNYQFYNTKKETPLNKYFYNCGKIFQFHFQDKKKLKLEKI